MTTRITSFEWDWPANTTESGKCYAVWDSSTLIALCPDEKVAKNVKEDYDRRHAIIVAGARDEAIKPSGRKVA
jgi:hypothetical protein